jgi:osmotically-inducible protein OsmY
VVLLLGQVPSKEIKKSYGKKASKLPGVKMVYNELKVGEPAGFGTYVNDSSITSSVKYTLTAHGIDPFNISVATQKGVVYLLGDVSEKKGDKAAKVASKISGVQKVVKVFPEN